MKTVGNQVKNYYELTKPKIWYLLVLLAFGQLFLIRLFDIPIVWHMDLVGGVAAVLPLRIPSL